LQDFAAQLEALIQAQPETASAKAAQALLAASAADAAARQGKPHTTQQVTEVSAKVQRAQSTFDKLQKGQAKLAADLEKNKVLLLGAASALAEAEQERAVLFKTMLPQAEAAKPSVQQSPMIDLSALLTSSNLDDSMISLNLGADFDNSDGVMSSSEVEELDRRKDAVKKALVETMKTAFGTLNDNLKEHRESLSALKEKNAKKRKTTPGPEAAAELGAAASIPVPADQPMGPAAAEAPIETDAVEKAKLDAINTKVADEAAAMLAEARRAAAEGSRL